MQSSSPLFSLFIIATISILCIASALPSLKLPTGTCGLREYEEMPCLCCKKSCWFTIAAAATHELGHMPGEAGEKEALATLSLIRACMISECSDPCSAPTLLRSLPKAL